MDRQVFISGEGVGIGNLKIPMNEQKTNSIKSQILEERFDGNRSSKRSLEERNSRNGIDISSGTGWKLLRKNLKAKKLAPSPTDENPTEIGTLLIPNRRSTKIRNVRASKISLGNQQGAGIESKPVESWKTLRESLRVKKEIMLRMQPETPQMTKLNKFDEHAINSRASQMSTQQSNAGAQMFLTNGARLSLQLNPPETKEKRRISRMSRISRMNRINDTQTSSDGKTISNDASNDEMPDSIGVEVIGEQSWMEELKKIQRIMVIVLLIYYIILLGVGIFHFVMKKDDGKYDWRHMLGGAFYCLSSIVGSALFGKIAHRLSAESNTKKKAENSRKTIFHPTATTNAYRRSVLNDRRISLNSTLNGAV